MIRFIFLVLLIAVVPSYYADARDRELSFQEPQHEVLDLSVSKELDERRADFMKCLGIKALEQVLNNPHKQLSYSRSEVRAICSILGQRYYEAVYAHVYPREANIMRSAKTARSSVLLIEGIAFDRIDAEIQKIEKKQKSAQ